MKSGLTLIEMLVVLTILALLASVAVTSTEGLVEQARHDSAQRGLGNIEDAILGPHGQRTPDGTPWVTGFVADVGRLPQVIVDAAQPADTTRHLQELWSQAALPAFTIAPPPGDPDVRIAAGWRGPYLRLPIGVNALRDPWGQPYVLRASGDDDDPMAGETVAAILCYGADHHALGSDYDADLPLLIHRTIAPLQSARHLGDVPVRVTPEATAGEHLIVRIYGPVEGLAKTVDQRVLAASSGTQVVTFTAMTTGPRVIRAYQTDTLPASFEDPVTSTVTTLERRSPVANRMILQGGIPEVVFDLSAESEAPSP